MFATHLNQETAVEEICQGVFRGSSPSGNSVFLHFADFGEQTGRFEIFDSPVAATEFLREMGVPVAPAPRGAARPRRFGVWCA